MLALTPWLGGIVVSVLFAAEQEPTPQPAPDVASSALSEEVAQVIDARVRKGAALAIRQGVVLFNENQDPTGCYRVYQGALISLQPLLDHRPQLQAAINTGLDQAAALEASDISGAAFELRGLLNQTFEEMKQPAPLLKPLWARLGGEPAVRAVVHDFVALAAGDNEVDFFRDGRYSLDTDGVAHLEQLLVEFISSATGGPLPYTGRPMEPVHEGMQITASQFNALAADLVAVLRKYEVPEGEIDELIAIIATTKDSMVEDQ